MKTARLARGLMGAVMKSDMFSKGWKLWSDAHNDHDADVLMSYM